MKKILYICSKNHYDWKALIPPQESFLQEEMDISILLLQQGDNIPNVPFSRIFTLEAGKKNHDSSVSHESLSYQQFLEKIFLVDLPLVM